MRPARLVTTLLLAAAVPACRSPEAATDLSALRAEVAALRDSATARPLPDAALAAAGMDSADVVVGLGTATLRAVLASAATRYLDDVRLHLHRDVVVTTEDQVRIGVGPLRVSAGTWRLAVTLERIDARLSADSVILASADSGRIGVAVPITVRDGTGDALIDFSWDASVAASVVCGDFQVRERFSGFLEPRTYRIEGTFDLQPEGATVVARPRVTQRIQVSPRPTEESWRRVRAILRSQDHIFECGLALSPEGMETRLRELLTRGFRFQLPAAILRPLELPTSLADTVDVAGRRLEVEVRPRLPRLTEAWLWLGTDVRVARPEQPPTGAGDTGALPVP